MRVNYTSLREIYMDRTKLSLYKFMAAPALYYRIEIYVLTKKEENHLPSTEVKLLR